MRRPAFERMVDEILEELPEEFARAIENVEISVEARPNPELKRSMGLDRGTCLLGFYQGVPLKFRSPTSYQGALPDRIVIFQESVESQVGRSESLREVLRRTILHEIAHYFGISDSRLRELGAY